jgi:hypothetical protein
VDGGVEDGGTVVELTVNSLEGLGAAKGDQIRCSTRVGGGSATSKEAVRV